jgi:hypothetical protein
MSLASKTFGKKSCFGKIYFSYFSYFSYAFSLGTNKEDLLHVTHYYLCSKFIYIKVISTCHAIDI